jgi:ParB-like chromosome segregation protein Spo0J
MKTTIVKISEVKQNPNNPRTIRDDKFERLVASIKAFPEMLNIRPIVVNNDMVVLGGNMRLKACREAGLKQVPIIVAGELTEAQQREFIIKDNVSGGDWDWSALTSEWDTEQLEEWGLDIPKIKELNEEDLFDIQLPFYIPAETEPTINQLANLDKTNELIDKINSLDINEDLKDVLKIRASFFTDFNFQKIADFYAKQPKEIQDIFKDLGMIILAPKEALEKGFIELSDYLIEE